MATTDSFYVSSNDNKVRRTTAASREYFLPNGKNYGQAKYIIEVFGYRHEETAKKVKEMVEQAGMESNLFKIRVETK